MTNPETDVGSTGRPGHAVAHPALVDDQGRAVGLVGELVAQPLDVGAHDLGSGGGAPGPDPAQQGLVGQDPAGVLRQHAQELVLGRRQLHRAPGHGDPPLVVVDGEGPERERDGCRPLAQGRPDPRRAAPRSQIFCEPISRNVGSIETRSASLRSS